MINGLFFIAIYFSLGELSVSLPHFILGGETFDLVGGRSVTILKLGSLGVLLFNKRKACYEKGSKAWGEKHAP